MENSNENLGKENSEIYTKQRAIEVFYNKIVEDFLEDFLYSINDENKREKIEKLFTSKLTSFNWTYWRVKDKFKYTPRDDWKRYFDHVVWVFKMYTKHFSNIKKDLEILDINWNENDLNKAILIILNEIDKVIIALEHDTLEDTDTTFEWLQEIHWSKIALSVALISKPPFTDFIEDEDDLLLLEEIRKVGILNSKSLLSDRFKRKLYIEKKWDELDDFEKIIIFQGNDYELTSLEKKYYEKYKVLEGKYKSKRNDFYFEKMKSFDSMLEYASEINKKNKLWLSEEELITCTKNSIYIKISDRIDNLSDIVNAWWDNPERIEKKLKETEKKLYPIAKEISDSAFKTLKYRVKEIRIEIWSDIRKSLVSQTRDFIEKIIK